MQAGPTAAPQKRLARLAVLLSRAALGLPLNLQASTRQSSEHSSQHGITMPFEEEGAGTSQRAAGTSGGGQGASSHILRGLAQLSLRGDARAEQALAEALVARDSLAEYGCDLHSCFWQCPDKCIWSPCGMSLQAERTRDVSSSLFAQDETRLQHGLFRFV